MTDFSFQRKRTYYRQTTYEFNLPAGYACPFADACKTKADRDTGKLVVKPVKSDDTYVCYAARAERFPGVRDSRWRNFEAVREALANGDVPFSIPKRATHVRIHGSGDFFNEAYFRAWCDTARANPDVTFWAFTKSIGYWADNLDYVPANLSLTASVGSSQDALAAELGLKTATVYHRFSDVPDDVAIDTDDFEAQVAGAPSFALLENQSHPGWGATHAQVRAHNARAYALQGRELTC